MTGRPFALKMLMGQALLIFISLLFYVSAGFTAAREIQGTQKIDSYSPTPASTQGFQNFFYLSASNQAQREKNFQLIKRVNFSSALIEATQQNQELSKVLESFAFSDAGAYWIEEVVKDNGLKWKKGYFEMRTPSTQRLSASDPEFWFHFLLNWTGRLSWEAFDPSADPVFSFESFQGRGGRASRALVSLGSEGFSSAFLVSCQNVDPLAILVHEFGHTKFFDLPHSHTLEGEREVIRLLENPVRKMRGFPPRETYYSEPLDATIWIESGEIRKGAWRKVQGRWKKIRLGMPCPPFDHPNPSSSLFRVLSFESPNT